MKKTIFALSVVACSLLAADTNATVTTTAADTNVTTTTGTTAVTTTSTTTTAATTTTATDANTTTTSSDIGMPPAPPSADITAVNDKGITHITKLKKGTWNLVSLMGYKPVKASSLFPAESADFIKAVYAFDNDSNAYLGAKPGVNENDVFAKMGLKPLKNISPDMGLWIYASDNAKIEYRINLTNPDDTTMRLVGPKSTIIPKMPTSSSLYAAGTMDESSLDKVSQTQVSSSSESGKATPSVINDQNLGAWSDGRLILKQIDKSLKPVNGTNLVIVAENIEKKEQINVFIDNPYIMILSASLSPYISEFPSGVSGKTQKISLSGENWNKNKYLKLKLQWEGGKSFENYYLVVPTK